MSPSAQSTIQPFGCLWTCDQPCAVALIAPDKPTYLFTSLSSTESVIALLYVAELYLNSTGDILGKHFPEILQATTIAKIPTPQRK